MCPSSPPFTSRAGRHATPVLKLRRAFRNIMLIGLLHAGFSELQGAVTIVSLLDEPSYQNVTQSGDGSVTLALPEIPVGGIIVQPEFFIGITTGTFVQEKAVRLLITETVHGAQTEAGQLRAAAFEPDDLIDESAAWSTSTDSGVSLSRYTDVMGETEITGGATSRSTTSGFASMTRRTPTTATYPRG